MEYIVAIENRFTVLDYAHNLSQFFYNNKLLTIIGEVHSTRKAVCVPGRDKIVSVAEYCYKELNHNPNAKLLLEYHSSMVNPCILNSKILRETYTMCSIMNNFSDKIIASDFRRDILTPAQQEILYQIQPFPDIVPFPEINPRWIYENYIDTFNDKKDEFFSFLGRENYTPDVYNYLLGQINQIKEDIADIGTKLKTIFDKPTQCIGRECAMWWKGRRMLAVRAREVAQLPTCQRCADKSARLDIRQALMRIYQKASDIKILSIILNLNTNINEFIVILGLEHFNYITYIINEIINNNGNNNQVLVTPTLGQTDDCVSLYRSFIWNEKRTIADFMTDFSEVQG